MQLPASTGRAQKPEQTPQESFICSALLALDLRSQKGVNPAAKNGFVNRVNAGDHMFDPLELRQIANETRAFTRDGFAQGAAVCNPACNDCDTCYLPDKPYECIDQRGHHAWLNAPVKCITVALQHYLHCKAHEPNSSICILVPYWKRASFWPLLRGMQIIRSYPVGTSIFQQLAEGANKRKLLNPWPAAIFYDPPQQPTVLGSMGTDQAMTFHGSVSGHDTSVLLDSGATHCFINETFCKTADLQPLSLLTRVNVTMANCETVATQQRCNVQLRIQGKLFVVCCYILPLPAHIGIILGQDWHLQHQVVTDWATMTCKVHHRHKQYVFTKEGCTQVSEDQPYLHHLQRVDDDYDPGESDPQEWDKIPSDYRPLIEEFRDIFPKDLPAGLPPVRPHVDHVIPTEGAGPPKARGRKKYSKAKTQEMQEQIEALRQKGFIQPSASPGRGVDRRGVAQPGIYASILV